MCTSSAFVGPAPMYPWFFFLVIWNQVLKICAFIFHDVSCAVSNVSPSLKHSSPSRKARNLKRGQARRRHRLHTADGSIGKNNKPLAHSGEDSCCHGELWVVDRSVAEGHRGEDLDWCRYRHWELQWSVQMRHQGM